MKKSEILTGMLNKAEPFGFYENVGSTNPSLASCQCGSGLDCSGGGTGGSCQCGSGLDCSGGGSGGTCQCGSGLSCSGSG